jgi:SAM-dependent methyltransferase
MSDAADVAAHAGPRAAGESIYDRAYYSDKQTGWSASAAAIVPALLRVFPARSVVDVGCGTGNLLAAFARHGVADLLGLDGDHVPRDQLAIAPAQFRAADLTTLADIGRRFDVACSLEFAEHLPPARAEGFVALLAAAAPVILFSAAVPGQGGLGHLNEQPQSWWARLFAAHGRVPVDCIRPAIQDAPGIAWYYAQNTLVYCPPERVPAGWSAVENPLYLDLLDDHVFGPLTRPPDSIKGALRGLWRDGAALWRALRRRVGRG